MTPQPGAWGACAGTHDSFDDFRVDAGKRELRRGESMVNIEPRALDLLVYLIENRQRVVSKDERLHAVLNGRAVSESCFHQPYQRGAPCHWRYRRARA